MKYLLLALNLLVSYTLLAQPGNIAQFAIWKPKEGYLQNFENGYKQHLNWHRANGDKWGWYGWFIISGPRYGQFVDATFDHTWADFDNAVKPAEDMADNRIHVFPFADLQTVFKVSYYDKASTNNTNELKNKLIRLITLTTTNTETTLKVIEKLKNIYASRKIKLFKTYKIIDGAATNQILVMMGFDNWVEYAISEDFNEQIYQIEQSCKQNCIQLILSETMSYRPDLSWFPE